MTVCIGIEALFDWQGAGRCLHVVGPMVVGRYPVDGSGCGHPDVGDVVIGVQVLLVTVMVMVFGADGELDVAGVLVSDEDEGGPVHVGELLMIVDDGLGDELVDGPRVVVLAVPVVVVSGVLSHGSHPCGVGVYLYGIVPLWAVFGNGPGRCRIFIDMRPARVHSTQDDGQPLCRASDHDYGVFASS